MINLIFLKSLAKLIRYYILQSTTEAGSGHPTSSLSATDLMTVLMFGGFFGYDLENPQNPNNDRLIFSKGHASPLFYALWTAAGAFTEKELLSLRKFGSSLEGHPTMKFPFTEAATGSLGQGLSVGVGMAMNAKMEKLPYRTFILLGDSEMAEGSVWEAIQIAAYYKLDNLIGILDVNRLGQRGETMYGYDLSAFKRRISPFGWNVAICTDGHNIAKIQACYRQALKNKGAPTMIIAKTIKGKGVKFLENKDGWHGKTLSADELKKALKGLGAVDMSLRGEISKLKAQFLISNLNFSAQGRPASGGQFPIRRLADQIPNSKTEKLKAKSYQLKAEVATRKAYGEALVQIFPKYPNIVVLDAEVSNSTYAEIFKQAYPERFFEMYIAEQNMVGAAIGLSRMGKIPFVSTFSAFFTRAYDQIRMAQYSDANIKFCGSHAGVSIGEDGASQMGLEDIAMFRAILNSVVLYPSDAVSTVKLVEEAAKYRGIVYIRTTRGATPVIYSSPSPAPRELGSPSPRGVEGESKTALLSPRGRGDGGEGELSFPIGGSKTVRSSDKDDVTIVAAGITLHEALKAHEELKKEGINLRVIDLYSIKPIDIATLQKAAQETKVIITVEDHFAEGGLGEAVQSALNAFSPSPRPSPQGGEGEIKKALLSPTGRGDGGEGENKSPSSLAGEGLGEGDKRIYSLAVRKMPMSGKPQELLNYEEISKDGIIKKVKEIAKLRKT